MAYRKSTTYPKFSVVRMDAVYLVLDHESLGYLGPYYAWIDADRECSKRTANNVDPGRPRPYGTVPRAQAQVETTLDELFHGTETVPTDSESLVLIADYRKWLPAILNAWAQQIAKANHFGCRRGDWPEVSILRYLGKRSRFCYFEDSAVAYLHVLLMPGDGRSIPEKLAETYELLAFYYLSTAPTARKARIFDMSKATYLRRLDDAHRALASEWVSGPENS